MAIGHRVADSETHLIQRLSQAADHPSREPHHEWSRICCFDTDNPVSARDVVRHHSADSTWRLMYQDGRALQLACASNPEATLARDFV